MPTTRQRRPAVLRIVCLTIAFFVVSAGALAAHDMFLKPTRYFAPENSEVRVRVLNGTFSRSENSIARARLADASVVSPRGRTAIDTTEWSVRGDTSTFHVHTRQAGTYVLGASTRPSEIDLSADDFNLYLQDEGVPYVLAERRAAGELGKPVRERYSKHVKAFLQVGDARTAHFATVLGYPAEIVPVENPYAVRVGGTLRLRALVDGRPSPGQLMLYGGSAVDGSGVEAREVRADAEGVATIPIASAGIWYVKFIHMARSGRNGADYESKWATITFEVR
ncbi:MAG: DUF4198 domain-containing protein [Gemmatimonadetes bacterium]|nr:DUF4198 domain-containing protein [Gemmatimonadota bacterium]